MIKVLQYSFITIALTLSNLNFAIADDKKIELEASEFVTTMMNDTIAVLSKKSSSTQAQYIANMQEILTKNFAVNYMASEVLGTSISKFDNLKKQEYLSNFKEYSFLTYAYLLAKVSFADSKFSIVSATEQGRGEVVVSTRFSIKNNNEQQGIDWRVKQIPNTNKFLVIDIIAFGVSLVQTKRSEFDSMLQANNNDVNKVLSSLKDILVKLRAQKLEGFKS